MTAEPKAPGAAAVYLYRQVDRDDNGPDERQYRRIKILTEEGRKWGDVEIEFMPKREAIRGIEARTIHRDGSVVVFSGTVYDKTLLKSRDAKVYAKTFTLPDVQVGSIIEYRYHRDMGGDLIYDSGWLIDENLFTKVAKFSLQANKYLSARMAWPAGLPPGVSPPEFVNGKAKLEVHDIDAFVEEDYMPPANAIRYHVDFVYSNTSFERDADKFWRDDGRTRFAQSRQFH